MKNNFLLILLFALLMAIITPSCSHNQSNSEQSNMEHKDHEHKKHAHSHDGFKGKISIEEIAKRLESPQRDSAEQPQKVVQFIGEIKGKTILDIGAGTGYYTMRFAEKGAFVIAADVNQELQDYLEKRIEKSNFKNVELRKTQYDSPLLKNEEIDIAFIANTYHHIENRIDYFTKVKKGLKSNGELVVVDYFNADLPKDIIAPPMEIRVSVDQLISELKKCGFTNFITDVNSLKYQYILKTK